MNFKVNPVKDSKYFIFISLIMILFSCYLLINNSRHREDPTLPSAVIQPTEKKSETQTEPAKPELKKEVTVQANMNEDFENRTKKALTRLHQQERVPSAQAGPTAQNLTEHPLLKSTNWKLWPNTKTITAESKSASDNVLAKVSNLLIVDSSAPGSSLTEFSPENPVAVYDKRLSRGGVITGIIHLQTGDKQLLENVLAQNHAHITDSFDSISTYYITGSDSVFDLENLYALLKSNPNFTHVELEILSKNYEKL